MQVTAKRERTELMNVLIFFLGFILAVVIGTKFKVNCGFIAIIFGFLITWFYLGAKSTSYVALFPTTLFWNYAMPIIFYAFANANGTLKVLGKKVVYAFRNASWALSISIMLMGAIIAASGTSTNNTFITAPLAWGFAVSAGLNPLLTVTALWCGSMIGSFTPWTTMGALHSGMMLQYLGEDIVWRLAIWLIIIGIVVFAVMFLILRGWRVARKDGTGPLLMDKPEAFNKQQKMTLVTILACIALLLAPAILSTLFKWSWARWMSSNLTVPITCSCGIAILCLLHIGDLKEVFKNHVNWNILWTIVFMAQYCGLAAQMGVTDTLAAWLENIPAILIAPCLCLIGAALSFVTSASTVLPLLYAMVPSLAAVAGVSVAQMAIPMLMGVSVTSYSPISTGGAAAQIGAPAEVAEKLFVPQMVVAICIGLGATLLAFTGVYYIGG